MSNLRLRRIDLLWLLVMAALAALGSTRPRHSSIEYLALGAIAVVQVAEMRFGFFTEPWGALTAVAAKLVLAWVLVGVTEGIESSYYLVFLLPVVSAASALGFIGTLVTALASAAAYCSHLLFVWDRVELDLAGVRELGIRVLLLVVTGILLNHFVTENRRQAERYRKVAEDLAQANQDLGQARAQVERSQRLAALGQLSAGLAHELRNPLGVIRGSAELLARNVPPGNSIASEMASVIAGEVDRTNGLVTRFLEFARPSPLQPARQDLRAVIERALEQLRRGQPVAFDRWHVEPDFAADLEPFPFDADLMERVFFNLLQNAVEAMPDGGTLRVLTRRRDEFAEATVHDTGAGIAAEDMESIFNPFFTTKANGVGLGLAIVSKIVDHHGGSISVSSHAGHGTIFTVSLPLAGPPAQPAASQISRLRSQGSTSSL